MLSKYMSLVNLIKSPLGRGQILIRTELESGVGDQWPHAYPPRFKTLPFDPAQDENAI